MSRAVRRNLLLLALAIGFFAWGVVTGVYRGFPWPTVYVVGQQVTGVLRGLGLMRERPDQLIVGSTKPAPVDRVAVQVNSGLLNFDLTIVNGASPLQGEGGGMALTGDGFLIARDFGGAVKFYSFKDDALSTLAFKLPATNRDKLPTRTPSGRKVNPNYVRYQDVEVFTEPDGDHLAVTLDYYDPEHSCFSTRLEKALLPAKWPSPLAIGSDAATLDWKILIDGVPCLPFAESRNSFGGNQAGGRIVRALDGGFFVSSGDLEFDGIDSKRPAVSQEPGSTYGRVVHVDPNNGAVEQWSMGLRNPQGMTLDSEGRLWTVEHGAMGGDELNWVRHGSNFGWPNVTLGVLYADPAGDAKYWPLSKNQGRHEGYVEPVFAWIPSIAPSAIALVENLDPRWDGDLLVSALVGQALHRLRMNGTSVVYDETVPMGRRIRDLAIAHGRIYLLFDDGTFGYMTPYRMQDSDRWKPVVGSRLQDSGCIECHSNPSAPRLAGAMGADIASQPDITYSAALKAAPGAWNRDTLGAFLADPSKFAPGTTMPKPGQSSEELGQIIDELEALRP